MKKIKNIHKFKEKSNGNNTLPLQYLSAINVLDELNIPHRDSGKNIGKGWIGVCCPFCNDNNYHMGINIEHKSISCFRCGTTGTILRYLSEELRSFSSALECVTRLIPRELVTSFHKDNERLFKSRSSIKVELPSTAMPGLLNRHAAYLQGRGFDPNELCNKYNLYSTGPVGKFPNRIIVPVVRNYRLITYTTISIADNPRNRYEHLEEELSIIPIKQYLYNIHTVNKTAFVVEGIFDIWRMGDETVPTFGTKLTPEQIAMLAKCTNVVLVFDGDSPGYEALTKVSAELAALTNVYTVELPKDIDPDKLSPEQIKQIKNFRV